MKFFLFVLTVIFLIFHPWFDFTKTLSSGDWPYLYPENIREFQFPIQPPFLWIEPYYQATAKIGVQLLSLSWETTEKIFWFIPIIFLSIFSSWIFLKYIFKDYEISDFFIALGSFIYITNTYFLMLVGGGQMGVVVAYSIAPLVMYFLIRILKEKRIDLKTWILGCLVTSIQLMFDPRIFLITVIAYLFFILFFLYFEKTVQVGKIAVLAGLVLVALSLNLFWIIPNISFYKQEYTLFALEPLVSFLSFATSSNSISLLHPNWPENVFGKIDFMKPEFIVLGIIPYVSLLFVDLKDKKQSLTILFFSFLGLLGSFLAKGINPPFEQFYVLLSNIPGSSIFRDPTKFYTLIVLSYSVLIPLSINFIAKLLNKKVKHLGAFSVAIFLLYLLILLRPAFLGQLTGTFSPHNAPSDYIKFKNFVVSQSEDFNTLWVPAVQRFSFSSLGNKAISQSDLFYVKDISSASAIFNSEKAKKDLIESGIKYIVVPYDSLGEIFLQDRKYDNSLYIKTISDLKKIGWLTMIADKKGNSEFGKIVVFEVNY